MWSPRSSRVRPGAAIVAFTGRYLLTDQVGVGAMGSVWRAWDLHERGWVAAKVLSRLDSGLWERFVREQAVRLRHPHVVVPTGWAADGGRALFTMDLVRGGSLEALLRRHGSLPESYVAVLLDQLLDALACVHGAGIVHRDVKPANLLLEPTGTGTPGLRLGDFGVAATLGERRLTTGAGAVGTAGYLSPEQVRGAEPDPRQDLYAVGVVAHELLTGRRPGSAPFGRGGLWSLVVALLAERPEKRPASASAARTLLREAGVPADAPWRHAPRPPDVPDLLGNPPPPLSPARGRVPLRPALTPTVVAYGGATIAGGLGAWLFR